MREHTARVRPWSATLILIVLAAALLAAACRSTHGAADVSPLPDDAAPPIAVVTAHVVEPVSTVHVPLTAKSSPEEPVLAPPEPTPGEVVAQGEPVMPVDGLRSWQLTAAERMVLYARAGVPTEYIPALEAIGECESHHSPGAVGDSGNSLGWFQLAHLWFGYAGEDVEQWADPATNLRTALAVIRYDLERGYPPFKQWSCQP